MQVTEVERLEPLNVAHQDIDNLFEDEVSKANNSFQEDKIDEDFINAPVVNNKFIKRMVKGRVYKAEKQIEENSDEDSADLDRTDDRLFKKSPKKMWSSNQQDTLKSSTVSKAKEDAKSDENSKINGETDRSELIVSVHPIKTKIKSAAIEPMSALKPSGSKLGNIVMNNFIKSKSNLIKNEPKEETKNKIINHIMNLGKRFHNSRRKIIVSGLDRNDSGTVKAMKTNIASRLIDGSISQVEEEEENKRNFSELDDFLLNDKEDKIFEESKNSVSLSDGGDNLFPGRPNNLDNNRGSFIHK